MDAFRLIVVTYYDADAQAIQQHRLLVPIASEYWSITVHSGLTPATAEEQAP